MSIQNKLDGWGAISGIVGLAVGIVALLIQLTEFQIAKKLVEYLPIIVGVSITLIIIAGCYKIKALKNSLLHASKVVEACCIGNHYSSHSLRDAIFEMSELEHGIYADLSNDVFTESNVKYKLEEFRDDYFLSSEKIMCDYCCALATSLKNDIGSALKFLGFKQQKVRVLVKLIDDTDEIISDGKRYISEEGAVVYNAIWDKDSWNEVKGEVKKLDDITHKISSSTALSYASKATNDYYMINNKFKERNYEAAPDIYENGYKAKLVLPIRYKNKTSEEIISFGFLVVLIENKNGEKIFMNSRQSIFVSITAAVADSLAVLISTIDLTHNCVEKELQDKEGCIKMNRRKLDSNKG